MFGALDHLFGIMIIIEDKEIDLPSLSVSLPSSFACFSFLSIALLIFCDHHGDDGEDLLTMTMNMVTIMTMMMTMTTKEQNLNLDMILINLFKLLHSLLMLVSVPP